MTFKTFNNRNELKLYLIEIINETIDNNVSNLHENSKLLSIPIRESSSLRKNKIDKFTIDILLNILQKLGKNIKLNIEYNITDSSNIIDNSKSTIDIK